MNRINPIIANMNKISCIINTNESDLDKELKHLSTIGLSEKLMYLEQQLDADIGGVNKIKICNYFCNTLYNMIVLQDKRLEKIGNILDNIICCDFNVSVQLKLYYLRFANESVSFNISNSLFKKGIRDILPRIPYFQILKYMLRSPFCSSEIKELIVTEYEQLFANPNTDSFIKMDIADTFILCGNVIRGYEMVNILRRRGIEPEKKISIYEDSQNVHSTSINESVLKVAVKLIEKEQKTEFDPKIVKDTLGDTYTINKVLERIEIDSSTFSVGLNKFNMYIVFSNIWSYIIKHEKKEQLIDRLKEEMNEMEDYCSTGHLSRLINVIQGFTEDDDLCIRISVQDQINSVISVYLDKMLQKAPDNVMDSIIEGNPDIFYSYVHNIIKQKMDDLFTDYGNVVNELVIALNKYTKTDRFVLAENNIILKSKDI